MAVCTKITDYFKYNHCLWLGTYFDPSKHMADFFGGIYLGISSSKTELHI